MKRVGRYELLSFVTGFSLLTYELAAARILAPSIGSSTYVWTSVIGVIIAALSAGFLAGGRLADSRKKPSDVAWLLLLASGFAVLTLMSYGAALDWVVEAFSDNRFQAVAAALLLFAPTSFFIGTTSPYLAKLKVDSLASTGQAVASLDTFNAVGGILGTFITGFVLFGYIGSREALGFVGLLLLAASWIIAPHIYKYKRLAASLLLVTVIVIPAAAKPGVVSIDTASAHYKVVSGYYGLQPVTGLITGPSGTQSAVYTDGSRDLVFWYTQAMAELTISREPDSVLMLGGGAFTLPHYLSEKLPHAEIDAVEIDPELKDISSEHFNYSNSSNVREIASDARIFVNQSKKQYDVILVDVYGDAAIPFTLMTSEYGKAIAKLLKPNGQLIANIIGGTTSGECKQVLGALDAAYRTQLPHAWYQTESGREEKRANHIVVYSRLDDGPAGYRPLPRMSQNAYTDNYTPAERLYYGCYSSMHS